MPRINIIAATSSNGIIGVDNTLPFHYSSDLKFFKEKTENSVVIMGRKTFESLGSNPLPNRDNIVITRNYLHSDSQNTYLVSEKSYDSAIDGAIKLCYYSNKQDIWVIGGASVYEEALYKGVDLIHLTVVPDFVESTNTAVRFPWINPSRYKLIESRYAVDEKSNKTLNFSQYKREF